MNQRNAENPLKIVESAYLVSFAFTLEYILIMNVHISFLFVCLSFGQSIERIDAPNMKRMNKWDVPVSNNID